MEDNVNVSGEIFSAKDNNPDVGKLKDFGWLSKSFEREKLISDNYYKSIRSRIHKGFKEEVINFNQLHALHILGRCSNPKEWDENKQGLVYGMVQSGKTANMLCLMGLANASGYNFMILLSSEKNSLRKQTQKRINTAFKLRPRGGEYMYNENDTQNIKSLTNIDTDYQSNTSDELIDYLKTNTTIIVCIKKNVSILKTFVNNLKKVKENNKDDFSKIKAIIIDDESDFASIDTSRIDSEQESEFKQTTAINNKIKEIRKTIDKNCYVQYTATPQACIAADPDSLVGYPKDFLWLLDVYKENGKTHTYLGHNEFFDDHKSDLIEIVNDDCWPHYIKDDEGKVTKIMTPIHGEIDRKGNNLNDVVKETLDEFNKDSSLVNIKCENYSTALIDFIITCSIRWQRHYKKILEYDPSLKPPDQSDIEKTYDENDEDKKLEYPYHSMIFNLAYQKDQLKLIQKLIDKIFRSVYDDYYLGSQQLFKKRFEQQILKSKNLDKTIPSHKELKPFIDLTFKIAEKNIDNEYIYLLYSGKDGDILNYDSRFSSTKKAAIIIGGHSLSRGLTVENLSTSFFIRSQVQSLGDTNLQMCRWFGHKRKDIDLISVYLMDYSSKLYSDLSKADNALRDEFKESIHQGRPAECFLIALQNNHLFAATSPKKSQLLVKDYKSSYSTGKKKDIRDSNCSGWEKNDEILEKFLKNREFKQDELPRKARVYKDIDLKEFTSFFKQLNIPESEMYTPENYIEFLGEYEKHTINLPKINIAIFGYDNNLINNMNEDFYYKPYVGGLNKNNNYAGDIWIDQSKKFHDEYFTGKKFTKRQNGMPILISFYRFNQNYTFSKKILNVNLTNQEKQFIEAGKNLSARILYTIITPLGGPTYRVSINKKKQELLDNSKCLEWEEKNSIYNE